MEMMFFQNALNQITGTLKKCEGESDNDFSKRQQEAKEKADTDLANGVENLPPQWTLYNSAIPVAVTKLLFQWGPHKHGY